MAGSLSGADKRRIRSRAHALKPVVNIGAAGLTASVVNEVGQALEHHEVIKVRLAGSRDEKRALAGELAERVQGHLAGTIGHVAILYKPHEDGGGAAR
jgi:RNA-binding protein